MRTAVIDVVGKPQHCRAVVADGVEPLTHPMLSPIKRIAAGVHPMCFFKVRVRLAAHDAVVVV